MNLTVNEHLVEVLEEGIDEAMDIDTNSRDWAIGAGEALYDRLTPAQRDQLIYWLQHPEDQ